MKIALSLAHQNLGMTWPNPSVGCVIINDHGQILSQGYTQPKGRPHAEYIALQKLVGQNTKGLTAYVTLEPCAHEGKTPPCVEALIKAQLSHIVIAIKDPDPRVAGKGIARLKEAGVKVTYGVCENEAFDLNKGFFSKILNGLPWITAKIATSLDGKIALPSGESQWISNDQSRQVGHMLRAENDAILSTIETIKKDNAMLNCRVPGLEACSPIRIILDPQCHINEALAIVKTAKKFSTWVFISDDLFDNAQEKIKNLQKHPLRFIPFQTNNKGHFDLKRIFQWLATEGITRLLCEFGGNLLTSSIRQDLIHELHWFQAPKLIGEEGINAIQKFGTQHIKDLYSFERIAYDVWDQDIQMVFRNKKIYLCLQDLFKI